MNVDSDCEICGARSRLEVHHIEPRRMGGSKRPEIEADSNKIVLCHDCHANITEQRWHLQRTPDELVIADVATGEVVVRRRYNPDFSPSTYFFNVQQLEHGLQDLIRGIPYLADDQLVELFQQLRLLDQRTWIVQAAICFEAKQRSVYGDRAWEAMGKSFGIGWRQAYNLARVWETFFIGADGQFCNRLQNSALEESTWYVVATETNNPEFWLAYAEDRKAEDPGYSIADFREEIRSAGAASESAPLPGDGRCRWLRVYCAKLGRVVSPGRCPGCDEAVPALEGTLR